VVYKKFNKFELTLAIILSVSIILFYFFFNLNYLTKWIDEKYDCTTYDYYVRLGLPQYLFNPHHIGFDWLGERMFDFLKKNGYTGSSMIVLQLRNLIVSSIGLGILFFLLYKISKKIYLSLLIIAMIAFSCAFWLYSQINDTPIIHSVLLVLLFMMTIYYPDAKRKYLFSILLGIFHSIVVFFHQSDLIFMVVIFFVYIFSDYLLNKFKTFYQRDIPFLKNNPFQNYFSFSNLKFFIVYFITFSIIVASAYYFVGIVLIGLTLDITKATDFNKIKGASYFFNWLVLYSKIDYWGKGFSDTNLLEKVLTGISTYFYQPQSFNGDKLQFNWNNFFHPSSILPNFIGLLFMIVFSITFLFFKKLFDKYNFVFIANIIFLVIYTIFSCWWEPDYREFWVATMFPFWLLTFFIFNFIIDHGNNFKPLLIFFIYGFLNIFVMLLFYFNFYGYMIQYAGKEFRVFDIIK